MSSAQENFKPTNDQEELEIYLNEQLAMRRKRLSRIRGRKRRLILFRMLSLFFGVILLLFGFIVLFFINPEDGNFNNILIFAVSELTAIPLLRYSWQVFRKMDLDQEISDSAELVLQTQDSVAKLHEERLKGIRTSTQENKPFVRPDKLQDDIIDATALTEEPTFKLCPKCAENVRAEEPSAFTAATSSAHNHLRLILTEDKEWNDPSALLAGQQLFSQSS